MITAGHCGPNKDFYTPIEELYVGHSYAHSTSLDTMLLTGSTYDGGVYTSTFNSNSGVAIKGSI